MKSLGFAGCAVGELRVRMHTGAGRITPGSLAVFPCGNNPAVPGRIVTGHEGVAKYLVVVTHRIELGGALEHDAVLHDQAAKSFWPFSNPTVVTNALTAVRSAAVTSAPR